MEGIPAISLRIPEAHHAEGRQRGSKASGQHRYGDGGWGLWASAQTRPSRASTRPRQQADDASVQMASGDPIDLHEVNAGARDREPPLPARGPGTATSSSRRTQDVMRMQALRIRDGLRTRRCWAATPGPPERPWHVGSSPDSQSANRAWA